MMPSYLIILILNLISLPPMLNLLSLISFISKFFFTVVNNIASIFFDIKANGISYAPFNDYVIDFL